MAHVVQLRLAERSDSAAIAALTQQAYAKWVPVIGRKPLPMTVDYAAAVEEHRFDLLFEGPALAGLIQTSPEGDYLLIHNVAVHPAYQGRGYGLQLLRLADDLAASNGLAGTRLYTNQRFTENVQLYLSLGYKVEREEPLNGGTAVHMVKERA